MERLLDIKNLRVSFKAHRGEIQAVRGASLYINRKEVVGLVGESGSGKSVTAKSIVKLLPEPPTLYKGGEVYMDGENLMSLSQKAIRQIRGRKIGMVFQDPMTSFNPTLRIGFQLKEALQWSKTLSSSEVEKKMEGLLEEVAISQPQQRLKQYPHELSGGMRQRIMIAMTLSCSHLLIADEPTTALDVTIQAQILELMKSLQKKSQTSILLITHDLGIVADICQRIYVMYGGAIMESGTVDQIYYRPNHPYTVGLLNSVPHIDTKKSEKLFSIPGTPPDLYDPPKGCPFYPRCSEAMRICREKTPELLEVGSPEEGHASACWLNRRGV